MKGKSLKRLCIVFVVVMMCVAAVVLIGGCTKKADYKAQKKSDKKTNQTANQKVDNSEKKYEVTVEKTSSKNFLKGDESVCDNTVNSMNTFAFNVYDKMSSSDNMLISPYSLYMALSILDNGATGEGKTELEGLLGIEDIEKTNGELNGLINSLDSDTAKVLTSNSLWFKDGFTFSEASNDKFIDPAKIYFNSDIFSVDFSKESTYSNINAWIGKSTNGMIDPYIKDKKAEANNSAATVLRIINAIYFEGTWKNKFLENDTTKDPFFGKKDKKDVDMMHLHDENLKYYENSELKAVSLPYEGDIVMDIIIPADTNSDIDTLYGSLTTDKKIELINNLEDASETEVSLLCLPKFEYETEIYDMIEVFRKMNVNKIFDQGDLFKNIASDICVGKIAHKAKIQVDENGTKAAAITDIAMDECCIVNETEFVANVPFIYIIKDTKTDTILFIGKIENL